jgi:hypothetical protein
MVYVMVLVALGGLYFGILIWQVQHLKEYWMVVGMLSILIFTMILVVSASIVLVWRLHLTAPDTLEQARKRICIVTFFIVFSLSLRMVMVMFDL